MYRYLENKYQYVQINGTIIITGQIWGSAQLSVVGQLLFILYINNIFQVSKILEIVLFGDAQARSAVSTTCNNSWIHWKVTC